MGKRAHARRRNRSLVPGGRAAVVAVGAGVAVAAAMALLPVGAGRVADAAPAERRGEMDRPGPPAPPAPPLLLPLGAAAEAVVDAEETRPTVPVALADWAGPGDVLAVSDVGAGVVLVGVPADPRRSALVEVDGAAFRRWSWGEVAEPASLLDGRPAVPVVVVVSNLRAPHAFVVAGAVGP